MNKTMKPLAGQLAEELKKLLGDNLRAVVLCRVLPGEGLAPAGDEVRLLVLLDDVEPGSLVLLGRAWSKYLDQGLSTPAVLDAEELSRLAEVFPLEFEEARRRHELILGEDPFSRLTVPGAALVRALEREAQQALLLLRQMVIDDPEFSREFAERLASVSGVCEKLMAGMLLLKPESEKDAARELMERVERIFGGSLPALRWMLGLKAQKRQAGPSELKNLFPTLLDELGHLARWLGELEEFQGEP